MCASFLHLDHDAARAMQKKYYREHGTTLQGLMLHHGIDPNDFLEKVHDIDYSWVKPDPELGEAIRSLPGRKFIFTNGDTPHAERTAAALGILDHFDEIFDIVAADLKPKPAPETYDRFLAATVCTGQGGNVRGSAAQSRSRRINWECARC
jgi:putative hydrolase of the HAD superfamily